MISIQLFGKMTVTDSEGQTIPVTGAKTVGLLAYLALNTDMPPTRDRLMALFWGDRFTDQARQSLRQAIAKLRRTLELDEDKVLLADAERVGLNPETVRVDVDDFTRLAADGNPKFAVEAVDLMCGQLLEGLFGQQSDFEDWIVSERQRIATMASQVFERAAEEKMQAGQTEHALTIARRLVVIDPLRDASQMTLIRILAQTGERVAAIQQFNNYEAQLKQELGVGVSPRMRRLMAEIRGESFMALIEEDTKYGLQAVSDPAELASTGGRPSIAIIPFASIAQGAAQEFFADGLTQDVTTNLSRFRWLDVRASPAMEGPRLTAGKLSTLGRELGLDYVVHGALRTYGSNMRLTVQLAEPATGRYLWVTRYDRVCEDLMDVQDELSDTIAASLEAELERLAGKATRSMAFEDMTAWDCYHRGLAIQYEFSADTNAEARKYFRRAIELDTNFAAAYARLSYALVISSIYFEASNVPELLEEALALAQKSCRLDPDDAVGRFALGRVYLARGEYDRSLAELEQAIALNPGMAQAHCALGDSRAYAGELDKAIPCFDEAVRLSPSDPYRWAFLGYGATAFLFRKDFEKAADWAAQAESVPNSHYWATAIKASALGHLGQTDKAREALTDLKLRKPGITCDFVCERLFYLKDPEQLKIYIEGLRKAGLQ